MPPVPGAPRNCSKCLYRHPPPTGQNCKLDILNMSLSEKAKLEHNRPSQSPEDLPEEVAGGSRSQEASEGDSEEEQPADLDKLTDWVDAQQTQIGDCNIVSHASGRQQRQTLTHVVLPPESRLRTRIAQQAMNPPSCLPHAMCTTIKVSI